MMKFKTLLFLTLLLSQISLFAQEESEKEKWEFLIEPYLMFPNMSGESGIRELPTIDLDVNASDIFSNLDFGAMLYMEVRKDKWGIGSDFVYMKLSQEVVPSQIERINSGEAEVTQLIWEVSGLYRVLPFLDTGLGLRFNNITMSADISTSPIDGGSAQLNSAENSEFWVDPVIIAQLSETINEKWLLQLRTDVGGFGIGSDFTWQLQAYAGYRFSKLFQTTVGYRIIGMDYDNGSGAERFRYDVDTSGPLIKLCFNF